jgi:hypothetical protein
MDYFIPEYSFIATIKCQTPGWEGYLDNAKIHTREENGERVGYREQTTWLTLNNFAPQAPHKFWFRLLVEAGDRNPCYEIRSAEPAWLPSFEQKDAILGENMTNSMGFYEDGSRDPHLFHLYDVGGQNLGGSLIDTGKHRGVTFRSGPAGYMTLNVGERSDDWQYWYGFVRNGTSQNPKHTAPQLIADLNILRMGVARL